MKARAAKYPVAIHTDQGGNVTKPGEFSGISDDLFADPVNYKYPMDDAHVVAAWAYISKDANQASGGYSDAEWKWMKTRVAARMTAAGHTMAQGIIHRPLRLQTMSEEQIKAKIAELTGQIDAKRAIAYPEANEQARAASLELDALYVQKRGYEDALATLAEEAALGTLQQGIRLHFFTESLKFDGKKVSGVAIHPKKLWHPEEGQAHLFLKEELKKSAPTLAGNQFGVDHLRLLPKPNIVERAWYDEQENGVAFEGTVDEGVGKKIKSGEFKGLSIELDWFKDGVMTERIGGAIAPRNFDFTGISFMSQFPPADKETYVKVWEGITLPIVPAPYDVQIDTLRQAIEDRLRYLEGQFSALTRTDVFSQIPQAQAAPAIIIFKEAGAKITGELSQLRATVDQLKTLKETYVTEKVARIAAMAEKEKHLIAKEGEFDAALGKIAEKLNQTGPKEGEVLVGVRKKLVEADAKVADLEKEMRQGVGEANQKYLALHKGITESIPPTHIWKCWTFGPKQMIAEQMHILGIAPNDRW
jgi:primosomal protein N''